MCCLQLTTHAEVSRFWVGSFVNWRPDIKIWCCQLIWTCFPSIDNTQLSCLRVNWQVITWCQLTNLTRNSVLSIDKFTSPVNWKFVPSSQLKNKRGWSIDNTAWKSAFVNWEVNLVLSIDMNMFPVNWQNSICVFAYQLTSPHLLSIDQPVEKSCFTNWQTCFINWQTYESSQLTNFADFSMEK